MKKPGVVKFIGNPEDYKICDTCYFKVDEDIVFDSDGICINKDLVNISDIMADTTDVIYLFTYNKEYKAYLLEYWQGKRESLYVECNDGRIRDFIDINDFEIIKDEYNVLSTKEAKVRCITNKFKDDLFEVKFGEIYIALGIQKGDRLMYLVMDESKDCYLYNSEYFGIVEDEFGILNENEDNVYYFNVE